MSKLALPLLIYSLFAKLKKKKTSSVRKTKVTSFHIWPLGT